MSKKNDIGLYTRGIYSEVKKTFIFHKFYKLTSVASLVCVSSKATIQRCIAEGSAHTGTGAQKTFESWQRAVKVYTKIVLT